jgi:TetR/AcrR family transcriptional repressor of nem operon
MNLHGFERSPHERRGGSGCPESYENARGVFSPLAVRYGSQRSQQERQRVKCRTTKFARLRGDETLLKLDPWYSNSMLERTNRRRGDTRERLLVLAELAVLSKGFAGTSIEELIAAAGITKSGFFYHFKDKAELAKALLLRYLERDEQILDDLFRRADELNEDPLHGFLIGLKLFAEMLADLPGTHPGCLAASYCYQDQLFNQEIRDLNRAGMMAWRIRFRRRLEAIAERYPPKMEVDLEVLADMATTLVEGGIVLARVLNDPSVLPKQVLAYRDFVKLLFCPAALSSGRRTEAHPSRHIRRPAVGEHAPVDLLDALDPGERHADIEFLADDLDDAGNARLPIGAEPIEKGPADEAAARAERQRTQHVLS